MNLLEQELNSLYTQLVNEVSLEKLKRKDVEIQLDEITESSPYFVALVHMPTIIPVYFCKRSREYLGLPNLSFSSITMNFYHKFLNFENGTLFQLGISHFIKTPYELFPFTCKVKIPNKGWRHLYGCSKMLDSGATGEIKHTLTILCDVEDLFEKQLMQARTEQISILTEKEQLRYLLLTEREREILTLVTQEESSQSIAEKLFISEHTVKDHRKAIRKKLQVKSSIGLVKYAIFQSTWKD